MWLYSWLMGKFIHRIKMLTWSRGKSSRLLPEASHIPEIAFHIFLRLPETKCWDQHFAVKKHFKTRKKPFCKGILKTSNSSLLFSLILQTQSLLFLYYLSPLLLFEGNSSEGPATSPRGQFLVEDSWSQLLLTPHPVYEQFTDISSDPSWSFLARPSCFWVFVTLIFLHTFIYPAIFGAAHVPGLPPRMVTWHKFLSFVYMSPSLGLAFFRIRAHILCRHAFI